MKDADLIRALKRMGVQTGGLICRGCGHEHNCGVHGCAVIREAAQRLEEHHQGKEHIDRETWEKPCSVCGDKTTLYQQTKEAQAELEKRLQVAAAAREGGINGGRTGCN